MVSEVEERIHHALKSHPLERIEHGYRLVHPGSVGVSTLRLLPVNEIRKDLPVVAIAEMVAEYRSTGTPAFTPVGIQRLNGMAVHGAYEIRNGILRQTAQFSLVSNEPDAHLVAQTVLNAFGGQLPIGLSTVLAAASAAALKQQQAHHAMPRRWQKPLAEASLQAATAMLSERGLAASNDLHAVWAEFPLSGTCPSRSIDPNAETALLRMDVGKPHPIAGAGYYSTIALPLTSPPADSAEMCRRLNAIELEQSHFAPRLGAWGLHGPQGFPGYSCFIPCAEPNERLPMAAMWWSVLRAAWIRDRVWRPQPGAAGEPESPRA